MTGNKMPLKLIISPPCTADSLSPDVNISLAPDEPQPYRGLHDPLTPPIMNPNRLSPNPFHLKMKANSLPSILDMENEENKSNGGKDVSDESSKSPISTGLFILCIF